MHNIIREAYKARQDVLKDLVQKLDLEVNDILADLNHIDRISFRVKGIESFLGKADDPQNDPPYTDPLLEIEDQVAGRVIVFFLQDIEPVCKRLEERLNPVESSRRKPEKDAEFGYESHHTIFTIPIHLKSESWKSFHSMPTTFEIQIRTLFMHAWAEPQHDLGYKAPVELPKEIRRELAWIAASSWGADQALKRVLDWTESSTGKSNSDWCN